MKLTLRSRILLLLVPPLVILIALAGAAGVTVLHLGGRIDAILRENYDSVIAMEILNEALERIDSAFQFALADQEDKARQQFQENWPSYDKGLDIERHNITLDGEKELVARLDGLTARYRKQGESFFRQSGQESRRRAYFGPGGLLDTFKEIKDVSGTILRINQESMEHESAVAKRTAREALAGFGIAIVVVVLLAAFIAWPVRAILRPIQAVTQSATAIGAGNLDQVVPVTSNDELGQLATAFNAMARQLREYRQSSYSRLLRAQRTSQATIDSFPDPVLVVDSEGFVEMANPAAKRLLGLATDKGEQQALVPWQPPEALRQPLAAALKEQRAFLPHEFDKAVTIRTDGDEHSLLPQVLPIRDPYGNTLGAAVLLQDVTRFRLLDRVKSDLVATVSHELKTPLTSIRLVLHLILEETVGPLTPKQLELLLDARENAERLLAQVNNLLDLTRLEEGGEKLALKAENPRELLETAAERIQPRAADKGIALRIEAPPTLPFVSADAGRFQHALANLLENALTYTKRGGRISLSAETADGAVKFTVADTGIGIPPEFQPYIFSKFFRVPGQSDEGGTGLGLAITREIVEAHGGSILCKSEQGLGTTFMVNLPVWKQAPVVNGEGSVESAGAGVTAKKSHAFP
ncbi:MAG TPA: ATP-binding protein [Gemmataceae bacterium]|jgi:PAS domain S-box-containing protein|nr:ATP-binding protein [Gemmataceae bacterium]